MTEVFSEVFTESSEYKCQKNTMTSQYIYGQSLG